MKKFLSLVLALVMVLSLGVTAGAVDFTDEAAITKEEAVGVLAGLGIINGYEAADGTYSFAPNGNITRGAAAKIICMIKLGTKVAGILSCETAPFSDVAKDSTFAPYIAYCANEGIVGGYPDGTFKPGNPVTGYAFTKMLLNALGIKGDYEGANYGVNVALAANEAELFEGMDADTVYAANCIREDACQLAFNALNYSATGKTYQYVVKDKDGEELYAGTDALTALVLKQADDENNTLTREETAEGSLGAKNFGLKKGTKTDDFGRKSTTYTNGKDGDDKVTYATFGSDAVKTYTTAVKLSKIWADLGFSKTTDVVTMNVKEDGGDATKYTVSKAEANKTHYNTTIGGQGTLVEVYKTATNTYDVIVVNTYVHKLVGKNTDIFAAVPAGTNSDAKDAYIKIGELEYKTAAFAKDDVVLYTKTASKIVNVVKAASISGEVTAVEGGDTKTYFRVDGVQYKLAAKNVAAMGNDAKAVIGSTNGYKYVDPAVEYTYYLDTYGNVIFAVAGKQDEVKAQYVYVTQAALKAEDSKAVAGTDLFSGTTNTTAPVAQVKVVDLATGAVSVKNIGIVKNTEGDYCFATKTGAAGGLVPAAEDLKDNDDNSINGKPQLVNGIYEYYTLADGSIVLGDPATGVDVNVKKDTAKVAEGYFANSATKLTVVTLTKNSKTSVVTSAAVATTTGIANFAKDGKDYDDAIVTANDNGVVSEIVAVVDAAAPTASVNYAIYKAPGEVGADTKEAFYQNGAVVEYTVADAFDDELVENAVYDLTITSGKLSAAKPVDVLNGGALTVKAVDSTYILVETDKGTAWVIYLDAAGCAVYDKDAKYAADTIEVGDVIAAVYGEKKDNGTKSFTKVDMIIIDN